MAGKPPKHIAQAIPLAEDAAAGMAVNERLFAAGLNHAFDWAAASADWDTVAALLAAVYLSAEDIDVVLRDLQPRRRR